MFVDLSCYSNIKLVKILRTDIYLAMLLSRDNQSQFQKIVISTSGVLFTAIFFIFTICLSACSSGSDTNIQDEETSSNKYHETSASRTGTLTLTISIQQKLKKKKTNKLSVSHYASSFDQILRLEQKVNIEQDFRYFETPPGHINSKERFRYFNTSPFWKIKGEEPKLSGHLKYESRHRNESPPRALGPLISETKIKGEAKPIRLKMEPVEPSRIGNGLALRLSWDFLGSQTHSKYFIFSLQCYLFAAIGCGFAIYDARFDGKKNILLHCLVNANYTVWNLTRHMWL